MASTYSVICLGRTRPDLNVPIEFVQGDLASSDMTDNLPRKIDAVVHLAQSPHHRDFPHAAPDVFRVNVVAAVGLLQWAQRAGATHFVHASTGGIYGFGPHPLKETDDIVIEGQLAYYYSTKHATEIIGRAYAGLLTVIALRYFFIYGPEQNASMLMPRLVSAVCAGRPIYLGGQSGMKFNPIDVRDAAAATIAALKLPTSHTINVAGPNVVTMRELGEIIGRQVGKRPLFNQTSSTEGKDLIGEISRMSYLLGTPRIGVEEGISRLCNTVGCQPN
jgi:UDP-glucose 4-epimerase